jgi:hypothetical protein
MEIMPSAGRPAKTDSTHQDLLAGLLPPFFQQPVDGLGRIGWFRCRRLRMGSRRQLGGGHGCVRSRVGQVADGCRETDVRRALGQAQRQDTGHRGGRRIRSLAGGRDFNITRTGHRIIGAGGFADPGDNRIFPVIRRKIDAGDQYQQHHSGGEDPPCGKPLRRAFWSGRYCVFGAGARILVFFCAIGSSTLKDMRSRH